MINYALRAAKLGAFYTAITSILAGIGLSVFLGRIRGRLSTTIYFLGSSVWNCWIIDWGSIIFIGWFYYIELK